MWTRQRKGNLGFWVGKYKGKLMESKGYFSKLLFVLWVFIFGFVLFLVMTCLNADSPSFSWP